MMKYSRTLLLTTLLMFSCTKETITISKPLMGTIVTITAKSNNPNAVLLAFDEISRIEKLMSPYKQESDVYKINNGTAGTGIKVSAETFALIKMSQEISQKTQGAFDITFVPLGKLYNYKNPNFVPPSLDDIKKVNHLIDYKNLILKQEEHEIVKKYNEVEIGLGAIAKGYAIGQAVKVLRENGIKSAIVESGGDLQVIGTNSGRAWNTGLMHPRKNEILMSVSLKNNESITTSGDYERYVEYEGRRYHHILNPKTGKPAETFASVSVIIKDAALADAYSTAIFVMGLDRTIEFLKTENNAAVIMIDLNMNIYVSKKLKGRVNFLHSFLNHKIIWI